MIQFSAVHIYMNMGKQEPLGELVKYIMFQIFLKRLRKGLAWYSDGFKEGLLLIHIISSLLSGFPGTALM